MKTIYALFAVALCIAVAGSCKKDSAPPTAASTPTKNAGNANGGMTAKNPETDPEEILYNSTLDAVAWGLLDLRNNATFRTVLNAEIAKQFDGDDNVLLLNLDSALQSHNINLAQALTSSLNAHGKQNLVQFVQGAIHGFNYSGGKAYTQVFIPFMDRVNLTSDPVICPNYEDDPVLPGFKVRATDGVIEYVSVNEVMAGANLIWVTSVNEVVDTNGKAYKFAQMQGGGNAKVRDPGDRELRISQINMTVNYDGFGSGRDEISYQAVCLRPGCSDVIRIYGEPFCKLAKSDHDTWYTVGSLNAKNVVSPHFTSTGLPFNYWEEGPSEMIYMVFYEADKKNKFSKTRTLVPGCSATAVTYVSKNADYGFITPAYADYTASLPATEDTRDYALSGGTFRFKGGRQY